MMRKLAVLLSFSLLVAIAFSSFAFAQTAANSSRVRKIVVFKPEAASEVRHAALMAKHGAGIIHHLKLINAVAVHMTPEAEAAIALDPSVLRIDDDIVRRAFDSPPMVFAASVTRTTSQPPQVMPWGISMVNAPGAWPTTRGAMVKVAVVDSGILLTHPDLMANIKGGINIVNPRKSPNDDVGHGTHVAGTIAAANNGIGVVGVAPAASLYAVKVMGANGMGYDSDIIKGLEWCATNRMQVLNMSLGGTGDDQSLHNAIMRLTSAGIVIVVAAGNDGAYGNPTEYPAAYPEVIAVSAVDRTGAFAWWSSYGPYVAIAAPGVDVESCFNNGYYVWMSGTSMACPHVTGVVALLLTRSPFPYGSWNTAEVRARLQATAQNLGLPRFQQGAGLVRADLAVK